MSGSRRVVAEGHVLEAHLARAASRRQQPDGRSRRRDLLVGVEQLEDPLRRGDAGLQQVDHRGDLGQRLGELARVLDERLHLAER